MIRLDLMVVKDKGPLTPKCSTILVELSLSTTTMAAGETTTPILRSGPSNNNESTPYDSGSYYGAAYGQAARAYVQAAGAAPPYPNYPSQNGGQEQTMQQINLASPPPPPLAADFKNADFF